jgi:hypothetical protein
MKSPSFVILSDARRFVYARPDLYTHYRLTSENKVAVHEGARTLLPWLMPLFPGLGR